MGNYGYPPDTLNPADLPGEVTDLYVFPYLTELDRQWDDLPAALSRGRQMFSDLGLIQHWSSARPTVLKGRTGSGSPGHHRP